MFCEFFLFFVASLVQGIDRRSLGRVRAQRVLRGPSAAQQRNWCVVCLARDSAQAGQHQAACTTQASDGPAQWPAAQQAARFTGQAGLSREAGLARSGGPTGSSRGTQPNSTCPGVKQAVRTSELFLCLLLIPCND
uniref:Secreted protein n=1 Tax=Setaria viridis TaxID=4556 RepID=A0A4U6TXE7_SETVI|nr:hypothetical protein SEVIR_7G279400v2 [Setaria viridis]